MMTGIKRILAWGPLTALTIMLFVTITVLNSIDMWLPPLKSPAALINYAFFWILVGGMLFNFFNALMIGPGYVPCGWRPSTLENDLGSEKEENKSPQTISDQEISAYLQYCEVCTGFKAPRAHHCRRCNRCVLKMDHHCPWINNCVGHRNQANFTLFLAFAVIGSIQSLTLLIMTLYRAYYATYYYYNEGRAFVVFINFQMFAFCVFSIGLSIGVIVAVGALLYVQLKVIITNRTSIEDWIVVKAIARRSQSDFIYPYNLGIWKNLKQTCCETGDGIHWEIVAGCNQYTLTVEQIEQKKRKREQTRSYQVVKEYNGQWLPFLSQGIRICLAFPCSDEPRIALQPDQIVQVTRWKKHWFYGQLKNTSDFHETLNAGDHRPSSSQRMRGWFPAHCVVETQLPIDQLPSDMSQNAKKIN